jgi:hypothetical protein
MAKKPRRKTSAGTKSESTVNTKTTGTTSSRASSAEFNPDYSAVKKDLKRIGLLAGSFFIILIILSFILR